MTPLIRTHKITSNCYLAMQYWPPLPGLSIPHLDTVKSVFMNCRKLVLKSHREEWVGFRPMYYGGKKASFTVI
jgi:hypothetical protein